MFDDHEDYGWIDPNADAANLKPLYNLHYIARAKPDEDERKIPVQHVAQGVVCYSLPKKEEARNNKTWLQWRKTAFEFFPSEENMNPNRYLVPLHTSRGKAGALNFVENYLFDFHCRYENPCGSQEVCNHALFSIADARHQYQPDFFHESIPYFFRNEEELNPKVAFTQCPQYFQEMPDESDYLDTNMSNFFRLGCILRNFCGGVSSCGTNGTWLLRDRRVGAAGTNSMWELEGEKDMDHGFAQVVERRFFHENCKVENTASSLDHFVKGKYSQYINMRLSYGMAKAPTDHLSALQRYAEGDVVLALQTFFGAEQGVYMIWITFLLFVAFSASIFFVVHGTGPPFILAALFKTWTGDDTIMDWFRMVTYQAAEWITQQLQEPVTSTEEYQEMIFQPLMWFIGLVLSTIAISILTCISYVFHTSTCCGREVARRTRFPTCMAQWARLAITVDNLTHHIWFWNVFVWIGYAYYLVWSDRDYSFETKGMAFFSWTLSAMTWGLILSASARNKHAESTSANEVFFLSLTNIWRTTQLYYMTAPLTVYSIITGTRDFTRHRMFGEDISFWVGGARGEFSKFLVRWWTLFLCSATVFTWIAFGVGWVPDASANVVAPLIIITFLGIDMVQPCTYLWLGSDVQPVPKPEAVKVGGLRGMFQRCCRRCVQLLSSGAFWKNCIRGFAFSPLTTVFVKWVGPMQHVLLPVLTLFWPFLGVHNVLLLLAATK